MRISRLTLMTIASAVAIASSPMLSAGTASAQAGGEAGASASAGVGAGVGAGGVGAGVAAGASGNAGGSIGGHGAAASANAQGQGHGNATADAATDPSARGLEKAHSVVETTSASQRAIDTLAGLLGLSNEEEELEETAD